MLSVFKVLDDVHHGLRVLCQLQLLLPVLRDLKHLEDDDGSDEFDNQDDGRQDEKDSNEP